MINVKDYIYNPIGERIRDDTTAIQTAIEDLYRGRGGTLFFPAGEYVVNAPGLVIPRGSPHTLIFRGEGKDATSLYGGDLDPFTPVIRYEDTNAPATNHQWEDMTIGRGTHGPVFVHASHGDPQRAESCVFRNINFKNLSFIHTPDGTVRNFSLSYIDGIDGLNEGQVPEGLREELNNIELPLSSNAYVEVEQAGYRWRVVDVKPGESNATELAIRKSGKDQNLSIHLGTGLTFSLEPEFVENLIERLDSAQLSAIRCLFNANNYPLSENAELIVRQPGKEWEIVDSLNQYIIRRAGNALSIFHGNTEIFAVGFELVYELDKKKIAAISCLFGTHNQNLSENAIIEVIKAGSRWKVIDIAKEYVVWKVDDPDNVGDSRFFVYISQAMTRIEGMLYCVLENVGIRGGVTGLRLVGSHFTTINLHTFEDFKQVNAVDVTGGNATMISTRIEACDGGFGLRLNAATNVILNGAWFEGEWTSRQIEITNKAHNITILNPAFGQPTQDYCIGLLVHGGAANVRVIGGDAGADFKNKGDHNYMLKVENGARHVHVERLNASAGFSRDGSSGNFWVEERAYDVDIELYQTIYKAGQIPITQANSSDIQRWRTYNHDTGKWEAHNSMQCDGVRVDDYNIIEVAFPEFNNNIIDWIVYGSELGYEGQVVRLIFKNDNATVRSCAGNIYLDGNSDFHPGRNGTLSLICDGNNFWYEIGRNRGGECPPRIYPPIPQDALQNNWLWKGVIWIDDMWMRLKNRIKDYLVPPRIG